MGSGASHVVRRPGISSVLLLRVSVPHLLSLRFSSLCECCCNTVHGMCLHNTLARHICSNTVDDTCTHHSFCVVTAVVSAQHAVAADSGNRSALTPGFRNSARHDAKGDDAAGVDAASAQGMINRCVAAVKTEDTCLRVAGEGQLSCGLGIHVAGALKMCHVHLGLGNVWKEG